jgi:hypothetical protein
MQQKKEALYLSRLNNRRYLYAGADSSSLKQQPAAEQQLPACGLEQVSMAGAPAFFLGVAMVWQQGY